MLQCCNFVAANPFEQLGLFDEDPAERRARRRSSRRARSETELTDPGERDPGLHPDQRSEREIYKMVKKWKKLVQPRAPEYFQTEGLTVDEILRMVAERTNRGEDPINVKRKECVIWQGWSDYGGVEDDPLSTESAPNAAILEGVLRGGTTRNIFVSRLMGFTFATPMIFERMRRTKLYSFPTTCGNRLCVNVNHILVPPPAPEPPPESREEKAGR